MNTIDLKSTASRTTIANGAIKPIKIEAEAGQDVFGVMFLLADAPQAGEHTEDHMEQFGFISYTGAIEDGCQVNASITRIYDHQDLDTEEEFSRRTMAEYKENGREVFDWCNAYFEVTFAEEDENGDIVERESEFYQLTSIVAEPEYGFTYSARVVDSEGLNGSDDGIHGFDTLEELEAELKNWTSEILGQMGSEDEPEDFLSKEFSIFKKYDGDGTETEVEVSSLENFYEAEEEAA